jgi:hypothetical protein
MAHLLEKRELSTTTVTREGFYEGLTGLALFVEPVFLIDLVCCPGDNVAGMGVFTV